MQMYYFQYFQDFVELFNALKCYENTLVSNKLVTQIFKKISISKLVQDILYMVI
jgi:hypothetical protein